MFNKKPEPGLGGNSVNVATPAPMASSVAKPAPLSSAPVAAQKASAATGGGKSIPSIFAGDISITGNILSDGEIQIDGKVEGDIKCVSLIVGENANVSGGIVAEDVVVRGKVNGSIRGVRVTLEATSEVEGDVYHKTLAIEQGAYFEGKSRRQDNPISEGQEKAAKPAATVAAPAPAPASMNGA
jgi:cytoskeletal protein CcmA (bactofilin family)